jgi:hypothetical protein
MRSLKQIEASRANGAKSRGPVTEKAGIADERNAIRYGLLAETVLLPGEATDRFLELVRTFAGHYKPANEIEAALIDNMAMARWRQLRVIGLQKSVIEREMARHEGPAPNRAIEAFKDPDGSLAGLKQDEITYECQFCRNLRMLLRTKESRRLPSLAPVIELVPSGATWDSEPEVSSPPSEPRA